jgi:hypothetical protein
VTPARWRAGRECDTRLAMARRVRRLLLVAIALLYALSIPWYRDADAPVEIWLGIPDWVLVALACYLGVAVLNAVAWLLADIHDEPAREPPRGGAP